MGDMLALRTAFRQTILPRLGADGFWDYSDYCGGTHRNVVRVSCIKPYPDRLMVAAQFIDCRPLAGGNLQCRVWVAPWDHACDGLERLQVGLCIIAFDAYEFSDAAAAGVAQRVLALDHLVPSLRGHVLAELAAPPLPSYRAEVYRAERRFVEAVVGGRDWGVTEGWKAVMADLSALRARQLKVSIVSKRVVQFMCEQREALRGLARDVKLPYPLRDETGGPLDVEAFFTELVRRNAGRVDAPNRPRG